MHDERADGAGLTEVGASARAGRRFGPRGAEPPPHCHVLTSSVTEKNFPKDRIGRQNSRDPTARPVQTPCKRLALCVSVCMSLMFELMCCQRLGQILNLVQQNGHL